MDDLLKLEKKPADMSEYLFDALIIVKSYSTQIEYINEHDECIIQAMLIAAALEANDGDYAAAHHSLRREQYLTVNLVDKQGSAKRSYEVFADLRENNKVVYIRLKGKAAAKLEDFLEGLESQNRLKLSQAKERRTVTGLFEALKSKTTILSEETEVGEKKVVDLSGAVLQSAQEAAADCPFCGKPLVRVKDPNFIGYKHEGKDLATCSRTFKRLKDIEKCRKRLLGDAPGERDRFSEDDIPEKTIRAEDAVLGSRKELYPEVVEKNQESAEKKADETPKSRIVKPLSEKRARVIHRLSELQEDNELEDAENTAEEAGFGEQEERQFLDSLKDARAVSELLKNGYSVKNQKAQEKEDQMTELFAGEDNYPVTELLTEEEEAEASYPVLIALETGEEITIDVPCFKIGKTKDCQLTIVKNTRVSRAHALILAKNGIYYIKDTKSTNGTFVGEGKERFRLPENTEMEIKSGQVIAFADQKYRFQMKEE